MGLRITRKINQSVNIYYKKRLIGKVLFKKIGNEAVEVDFDFENDYGVFRSEIDYNFKPNRKKGWNDYDK